MIARDRNVGLERELVRVAHARAGVGVPVDPAEPTSLDVVADARCAPGPVRLPRDFLGEAREELADARNYCVWEACEHYGRDDPESVERYQRAMRWLTAVTRAWHECEQAGP